MRGSRQWGVARDGSTVIQAGRDVVLGAPVEVDPEVAVLAEATEKSWFDAETTWRLSSEAPVKVSWEPAGPGAPLLLSEDVVHRLHDEVYDRPGPGVVVVVGAAGIGKSTVMLLLLREALRRRRKKSLDERGDPVQVPVWLTLGDWDPAREELVDYASRTVSGLLRRRRWSAPASGPARRLVSRRRVALFLDGLDEMPEERRGKAVEEIRKLGHVTRVVVTTRPGKRGAAYEGVRLAASAVIRLRDVDTRTAADFLARPVGTAAPSPRLLELARYVRANPRTVLAKALTTPLTIGLARDAFGTSRSDEVAVAELAAAGSPAGVVSLLAEFFLDRAYSTDGEPGSRRRRSRLARRNARERAFMVWIAQNMGANRDLVWWRIPAWVPLDALRVRCGLVIAAAVGLVMAVGAPLVHVPAAWYVHLWPVGQAMLYVDWQLRRAAGRPPTTLVVPRLSARALTSLVVGNCVAGLVAGAVLGSVFGLWAGVACGGVIGVMGLLGSGLYRGRAGGLLRSATASLADSSSLNPVDAYRADRRRTAVTAVTGAVVGGVLFGLIGAVEDLVAGCALWGVGVGLAIGWVSGMGPGSLLPFARPHLPGHLRSAAPLPALGRAVEHKVLRRAGVLYQFRHAAIQDHLRASTG